MIDISGTHPERLALITATDDIDEFRAPAIISGNQLPRGMESSLAPSKIDEEPGIM